MIFSKDILKKMFEESFDDEVENIYSRGSLVSFYGEEYSMEYNFLGGYITFSGMVGNRIGTIFISECNIFELKLKKFINSKQKRSRRKFLMR